MALTIFGSVLYRLSPGQPCPPPEPELVTYTLAKVQTNAPMYPPATVGSLRAHPTYFLWVAALLVPVSRLVCLALQCLSYSEGSCWSFSVSWESQPPHCQVSGRAAGSLWGERKSNVLLPERNGPQILSPWQDVEDRNHKLSILGRLTQTLYFRPLVQPRIFIVSKENLGLGTPAEWGQELWLSHSRSLGHRTIRGKKIY